MNLRDYEWSHNPRGLRNKGPFRDIDVQRYTRPQMGWAVIVAGTDEYVDEAEALLENNITPIVRLHRSHPGAVAVPDDWYRTYQAYYDAGVRWFELYNEPNTAAFWPKNEDGSDINLTWRNEDCIEPLMDHWLDWAEHIIEMGGYPAFPALSSSTEQATSTVYWLDAFVRYLKAAHEDRFMKVIAGGLWAATHPKLSNHFYQEPPGGPPQSARPYYQQSANEGGWHFEYPYDPISQRHDPGRTVFQRTTSGEYGDVTGLVAPGEALIELLRHHLSAGPVPIVATEGGILPLPTPDEDPLQPDDRFPPYSHASHAEAVLAMWKWIVRQGPPWFFGMCLSDEAEYYEKQGTVAAIDRAADEPPMRKEVADLDTGGTAEEAEELPEEEADIVDGEVMTLDGEDEDVSPDWVEEAERRAEIEEAASQPLPQSETNDAPLPPELSTEGVPDLTRDHEAEPEPERLQSPGLDHEAEEMIIDAAEGYEAEPEYEATEDGEIPEWLRDELPIEEQQRLMAEALEPTEDESLEELIAIDTPEEPLEYDEYDVDEVAAEEGRPESEVDPDYKDLSGQVVDAWQQPETAGTVPDIRLDDLPEDMQEQLAALTGAEEPEALDTMTEEDGWREEPYGDQPDDLPRDLEETEDILLGSLGTEPVNPKLEEAYEEGEINEESDRATNLTEAIFEAGEIEDESHGEFGPQDEPKMPWEEDEESGGVDVPPAAPVAHPHQGVPSENIETDLIDMTGDWSEEDEMRLGAVPAGDFPTDEEVEEMTPDEPELSAEAAIEAVKEDRSVEVTHHWVVFAPGVEPRWFFQAGSRYWQKFRPTVAATWQQTALIPVGRSVAVTVLVPSEEVEEVTAKIHTFRPDVIVDPVECDTLDDVQAELDWRARTGRRLG